MTKINLVLTLAFDGNRFFLKKIDEFGKSSKKYKMNLSLLISIDEKIAASPIF